MTGIKKLHDLDQRVTLLNDPKALSQEWTEDVVRLAPDAPPDVGKSAIFASDERSIANASGSATSSQQRRMEFARVMVALDSKRLPLTTVTRERLPRDRSFIRHEERSDPGVYSTMFSW